jgi:Ser/Thr protein kinase RdoA (MazF antagonist)
MSLDLTLHRRGAYGYATTHPIDVLADEQGQQWLAKDLAPAAVLPDAVGVAPAFVVDPRRELAVYRDLLAQVDADTAACAAVVDDPATGTFRLVIEHVDGQVLWQVGEIETWCEALAGIAGLHSTLHPFAGDPPSSLLRYDLAFLTEWGRRAAAAVAAAADTDADDRRALAAVLDRYRPAIEHLLALPQAIIHGELYPSNVVVERTGGHLRVCPIDWEMAAVGPVAIDVAALTGGWPELQRQLLLTAYAEAAGEQLDELTAAVDVAELHLCVRWLGWAEGWQPPSAHATDWLGRAVELIDRIPA